MSSDVDLIKSEQAARIVLRDTTLYVNAVAILTAISSTKFFDSSDFLWVIPIWSFIMTSIYFSNDVFISLAKEYALQKQSPPNWDSFISNRIVRRSQKFFRLVTLYFSFLVPSVAAIWGSICFCAPIQILLVSVGQLFLVVSIVIMLLVMTFRLR
jgi:hypothetical protein